MDRSKCANVFVDGSYFERFSCAGSSVVFCESHDNKSAVNLSNISHFTLASDMFHSIVEAHVPQDGSLGPVDALTAELYSVALAAKQAINLGYKSITIRQDCKVSILFIKWIVDRANASWLLFAHDTSSCCAAAGLRSNMRPNKIPKFNTMPNCEYDSSDCGFFSIQELLQTYSTLSTMIWHCAQFLDIRIEYIQSHSGLSFENDEADQHARLAAKRSRCKQEQKRMNDVNPFFTCRFPQPHHARPGSWLGETNRTTSTKSHFHWCERLADYSLIHLLSIPSIDIRKKLARTCTAQLWNQLSWHARLYMLSLQPCNSTLMKHLG